MHTRRLILLADGALLHARNVRAKERGSDASGPVLDFLKVPTAVAKTLGSSDPPPATDCHWFMVGAQNAGKFIETISHCWSVHEFPLRAFAQASGAGDNQVRFTSAIAWALGNVASSDLKPTVVVVSNDPAVIFPARFTIDRGTADVLLAWPDPLGEEARYFADANNVRVLPIDQGDVRAAGFRPSFGRTFLAPGDAGTSPRSRS